MWSDPEAPPDQWYRSQAVSDDGNLVFFGSPDGLRWRQLRALDLGAADTQSVCFWDSNVERYVLYTRRWVRQGDPADHYRIHRGLESDDLVHWQDERTVFVADGIDLAIHATVTDQPPVDYYGACVHRYEEADDVYLMFAKAFWNWSPQPGWQRPGPNRYGSATAREPRRQDVRLGCRV